MGTEKRLEAGWFQRIAWAALGWFSLGLLVWVPFLYVAIRRGRPSDWGAFASFAFYECLSLPWSIATADIDGGDPILGLVVILTLLMASAMLLFAMFDKRRTNPAAYGAPVYAPQPPQPQPYGYGQGGRTYY